MFGRRQDQPLALPGAPITSAPVVAPSAPEPAPEPAPPAQTLPLSEAMRATKENIYNRLMEQIDLTTASRLPEEELRHQITDLIGEIVIEKKLAINQNEQQILARQIVDDMIGLGPLEPLLKDESITDIMVNGPEQIYIERKGKLELTAIRFRDNEHVMNIAQRIVTAIGRRVDESSPVCDARLKDGSRVNVIAPPLALRGACISIRKFAKKKITLDIMAEQNNISESLCKLLKIAGACRLNIIISGGTGSGKTTLLNALSRMIDHGERVVTIEDAAELQLQQPHVVPLETRPANLEGDGEITMRDLVKNALRMRPDRIILGEVRGGEALDLLQAMNTGHDGSLGTLHANNPREALTRLENMVNMSASRLPSHAIRHQISSAVDLIIQIQRMRDGQRRVTHVTEVIGMEGDVIITQDLYTYQFQGEDESGRLLGEFKSSGLRPYFTPKAAYFGLDKALLELI
jgi:pilus assembly protein CpaF